MLKKILIIIIRVIIGAVFCFSAYTKLHPVEPFEMMFVEMDLSNWELAPFIARLFISVEFLLGVLMIFSLIPKITAKLILFVLLFFTGYLIYILLKEGNSDNCGCFGVMIKMNPVESILKNIVLIGLTMVLLFNKKTIAWNWKYNKFLITGIIIACIAVPIILNPPDFIIHYSRPPEKSGYKLNIDEMGAFSFQNSTYHLSEGKKVVCFFSLKCRFCKLAAHKLTIIQERIKQPLPVYYVMVGETKDLYKFWAESKSYQFPNMIEPTEVFFKYSGNSLPAIYLLDNDIVYKKLNFDELSEKEIVSFLFDK